MLKPARANSCTVASCSEPLGMPSFSELHRPASVHAVSASRRSRCASPVWQTSAVAEAASASTSTVSSSQSTRACATCEPVARRLALGPQRVAGAAEEGHVAGAAGDVPGLLVHEADHQHLAAVGVLHHRRHQAVQFREIDRRHGRRIACPPRSGRAQKAKSYRSAGKKNASPGWSARRASQSVIRALYCARAPRPAPWWAWPAWSA